MKKVLLICPDARPELDAVSGGVPLPLAVFIGKPLIDHVLDGLARQGVTHVRILASVEPAAIRAWVTTGAAWGLQTEVVPEAAELSRDEAAAKHAAFQPDQILTLDTLPQAPEVPLLTSAAAWHSARGKLLPVLAPMQVGAREISPGVWLGLKAKIENTAQILAPCWVGPHSIVRAHALAGPHCYIESDSLVDAHATVEHSTVGSRTYLGGMTHLRESIAAGSCLTNWRNGSSTRLTDAFLLSPLDPPREAASSIGARFLALLVLLLTLPLLLIGAFMSLLRRKPVFETHTAVLPPVPGAPQSTVTWRALAGLRGHLRRWPVLWRIVTGHFAWTGNPPLTPSEAARLDGEFERLWLHTAPGLFTAPEAEGCQAPWDDAARAHAALFACQPTAAWRLKTIRHGLTSLFSQPVT